MEILKSIENRRTYYNISPETTIPDHEIEGIIKTAAKHSPSAFNSQSSRIVLLLGKEHKKLWEIVLNTLRQIVPEKAMKPTEDKIASFANGYGSILFFEDQETVKGLQDKFPTYADNFPKWSLQSSGMVQLVIWAALEEKGMGVSLQHYNPLIDEEVAKTWSIPASWSLISQMPFGKPTAKPDEKTFLPIETRVKVIK